MKLAELKRTIDPTSHAPVRGTDAQDKPIEGGSQSAARRRIRIYAVSAGALVVMGALAWLAHAWMNSRNIVSRERLRTATSTNHLRFHRRCAYRMLRRDRRTFDECQPNQACSIARSSSGLRIASTRDNCLV